MNERNTSSYGLIRSTNMIRKDKFKFLKRKSASDQPSLAFAVGQRGGNHLQNTISPLSVHLAHDKRALKRNKNTHLFFVVIPKGIGAGEEFFFFIEGDLAIKVIAPLTSKGDDMLIVNLPKDFNASGNQASTKCTQRSSSRIKVFDIVIPDGSGEDEYTVIAGGRAFIVSSFLIKEKRLQLHLPIDIFPRQDEIERTINGWCRAIRIPGFGTQWVRSDNTGKIIQFTHDIHSSAYIREVNYTGDNSLYMLEGQVSLCLASNLAKNSKAIISDNLEKINDVDLVYAQNLSYSDKLKWFRKNCSTLSRDSASLALKVSIQRDQILPDTLNFIMSLSREDLLKKWSIQFTGETSIDSNIATKEWFDLITEEILHPQNGLFQFSANNNMLIQINPCSGITSPDTHLIFFRVLGRILAKAVCEGYQIPNHLSPYIFKLLVGWPLVFEDLKFVDEACYDFLLRVLRASSEQLSKMRIPFTAIMDVMGSSKEVNLIPGGSNKVVTVENRNQYLELSFQYYVFGEVKDQMTELLLGYYDVIPECLVSVFNPQEIELIMSGSQQIDLMDWKKNTEYTGEFQDLGEYHPVCCWFWDMVENFFDHETRMQLLEFVTGLSSVPIGGFSELQGEDGQNQKFTLHGTPFEECPFPKADIMLNRILLPLYENSNLMYETLVPSIKVRRKI